MIQIRQYDQDATGGRNIRAAAVRPMITVITGQAVRLRSGAIFIKLQPTMNDEGRSI